jgi:hypothetical protein
MSISDLSCHVSDYCINITKKSDIYITVSYHAMSLTTVQANIAHCDRPITLCDTDTVVRHSVINHCDIRIPLLSDTDTVV